MSDDKLKQCPFCGRDNSPNPGDSCVECLKCKSKGPLSKSQDEAEIAWNRRSPSPTVARLIKAARKVARPLGLDMDIWEGHVVELRSALAAVEAEMKEDPHA